LHGTIVAGGGGGAGGACAAVVAAASTPPCPEHAPDPVAFECVPSLQTLAGAWARSDTGSAMTAASAARPINRFNKGTSSIVEERGINFLQPSSFHRAAERARPDCA
jgi:hypothetical protein